MRFSGYLQVAASALLIGSMMTQQAFAWGQDGHMMINHLAITNLPSDVPAFLRDANAQSIVRYLGPEPDRWRNSAEGELSATQAADHFLDMEYSDLVGTLPKKRYDYVAAVQKAQSAHPTLPLTPEKVGFQPYQVEEVWQRLKSSLRDWRKLSAAHQDTKGVEDAILFYAGWLGHYVGDGSQPLHTTIQYNGWTGANPNGYTIEHKIHSQFETVYVTANVKEVDVDKLVAASPAKVLGDEWADYLAYLQHSNTLVEKTYQLEKAGGFTGAGTADAKTFTQERLAAGAIELRDLIYTAWVRSADPVQEYHGAQ